MKCRIFLLFLLAFRFISLSGQTESFRFEHFEVRDGLCHNRLTSLHQDNLGFVWVASENGLSRFDGRHFKNFFPKIGDSTTLSSEVIYKIQADEFNHLWFETQNGMNIYDAEKGNFRNFQTYPRDLSTRQAARLSGRVILNSKIYFVPNARTLAFFNPLSKKNKTLPLPETFEVEEAILFSFCPSKQGAIDNPVLGMATTRGFYFFNISDENWVFFPNSLPSTGTIFLGMHEQKIYYSIWEKGLFCFDLQNKTLQNWQLDLAKKLPNIIYDFLPLSAEEWWLGTESGLYILHPMTGKNNRIALPNEANVPVVVRDILKDQSSNIWLATENGLLQLDPRMQGFHYQKVSTDTSPVYENQIYDIEEAPDLGKTFVVSRGGHLYVLDKKKKSIQTLPLFEHKSAEPTELFRDSHNRWWLLTRREVYHFDPQTFEITLLPTPPRREGRLGLFWDAEEDGQGRIWFALSRDGIFIYDPSTHKNQYLTCQDNNFCPLDIWDIKMDIENGKVWVATDSEGLWEGDLNTLQFRQFHQKNCPYLSSDQIVYLEQDQRGILWLSTTVGLCRFDWRQPMAHAFQCFTVEDGLPVNFLEGLTLDLQGHLWGGSTGKLVRIEPETMKIETFDQRFGLDFTPFPISNIKPSPSGELFAGGKFGFLKWSPQKLKTDTLFPKIVLTGVKVLGQIFKSDTAPEVLEMILLNHRQHSLIFEFTTLDFTLPDFNRFDWKLEGYDKHWTAAQAASSVAYTQIPPGDYWFKVRNTGEDFESENALNIRIKIIPAFWQTLWFQLLCLLSILAIIYGIYRQRIHQIREKESLKTAFQKRIAEIEMASLRAQMNPHFVFNCLNSINRFIQLSDPDTASDYLTKFSRLIRLVLDNSREETVSLENEIKALRLYVELEALRFAGRFEFEFFVDENLDTLGIDIPPLLIQPYVENAIWHGLMHKEDDSGRLKVSFLSKSSFLTIIIEDNGIGRAAATELKSKTTTWYKSQGMALTQERLDTIRELFDRELFVEVQDLVNPAGKAKGTKVILKIPFS